VTKIKSMKLPPELTLEPTRQGVIDGACLGPGRVLL
jgi:hypothetical protein